jgi:hypothetical protein
MSDPSPVRLLRLRRPDRCTSCGRELTVGDQAFWDSIGRIVFCLDCPPAACEPSEGLAGRARGASTSAGASASAMRITPGTPPARSVLCSRASATSGRQRGQVAARPTSPWQGQREHRSHRGRSWRHHFIDTKRIRGKVRAERVGGLFVPRQLLPRRRRSSEDATAALAAQQRRESHCCFESSRTRSGSRRPGPRRPPTLPEIAAVSPIGSRRSCPWGLARASACSRGDPHSCSRAGTSV